MARGDSAATRHRHVARQVGELARAFNRMGGRPRRDRPDAPGPRRQRDPRAANADLRLASGAREPRRRRRGSPTRRFAHDARADESGSAVWSRSCSTFPGWSRAVAVRHRSVAIERRVRQRRARGGAPHAGGPGRRDRRRPRGRARRSTIPSASTRCSPTSSRARHAHSPRRCLWRAGAGSRRGTSSSWWSTKARDPRRPSASGCSSASTGPMRPRRGAASVAAQGSAWRSPVGSSSSTAATIRAERRVPQGCRMVVTLPRGATRA